MKVFFLLLSLLATPVFGAEYEEMVVLAPENPTVRAIEGLELPFGSLPVEVIKGPEGPLRVVAIHGEFIQPLWTLTWEGRVLADDPLQSSFTIQVPLKHSRVKFTLTAVSAEGDIARETFIIKVRSQNELRGMHYAVSVGLSKISYHETRIPNYEMTAVTAKGIAQYVVTPGKYDLMIGGFMNIVPLTTNRTDGAVARFVGINLRAGYIVPFVKYPWRLSLNAGLYYTSMQVTNDLFGFSDMFGPQIFLVTDYAFSSRNRGTAYFKFSPVSKNLSLSLFDMGNREIAAGGGWIHQLPNQHPLSVMMDFSFYSMVFGHISLGYNSTSLSVGYGF